MHLEVKLGTSPLTKLLIEMEIGFKKTKNKEIFWVHLGIMALWHHALIVIKWQANVN
jgi:hypothetical protein